MAKRKLRARCLHCNETFWRHGMGPHLRGAHKVKKGGVEGRDWVLASGGNGTATAPASPSESLQKVYLRPDGLELECDLATMTCRWVKAQ